MVLLAEVMKIKTLTAGNSLKNNTGFTLIELLVVVVIVGILASFITLSVKLAKPSAIKTLKMKIQQHIVSVETYVQLYNQPIRLQVSQGKMQTLSFQFKVNTDDEEAPLEKSFWQPSSRFQPLIFKPIKVSISKANSNWKDIDAETIEILPNGFITDATISLSQDDELISFKTIEDETK